MTHWTSFMDTSYVWRVDGDGIASDPAVRVLADDSPAPLFQLLGAQPVS